MKTIPLLMQPEMVRAILDGRKTQTRRTKGLESWNKNPDWFRYDEDLNDFHKLGYIHYFELLDLQGEPKEQYTSAKCKAKPGDIFWVRETFGVEKRKYKRITYKAGDAAGNVLPVESWKPSIDMPKSACRIWLKVTDVKAERLQDISQSDAENEGIKRDGDLYYFYPFSDNPDKQGVFCDTYFNKNLLKDDIFKFPVKNPATLSFYSLWRSINGNHSWNKNPWVWVYSFERCEMPEGFLKS